MFGNVMYYIAKLLILPILLECVEGSKILTQNYGNQYQGFHLNGVDLDISEDVNEGIEVRTIFPHEIEIKQFRCLPGFKLAYVLESLHNVWASSNEQVCTKATVAYDDNVPTFLTIICNKNGYVNYNTSNAANTSNVANNVGEVNGENEGASEENEESLKLDEFMENRQQNKERGHYLKHKQSHDHQNTKPNENNPQAQEHTEDRYEIMYMINSGEEWLKCDEKFFYNFFNEFVLGRMVHQSIELDISSTLDEHLFYVNTVESFPFIIIIPNVSVRVHKVTDSGRFVWSASSTSKRCLYISIYNNSETPLMCLISNADPKKYYYHFTNDQWSLIPQDEYYENLRLFGIDLEKFDNKVELNVDKVDAKFVKHKFGSEKIYLEKISPKPGYKLTSITSNNGKVWSGNRNEYCTYIDINMVDPNHLMTLYIKSNNNSKVLYFCKYSHWKAITSQQYHQLLTVNTGNSSNNASGSVGDRLMRSNFVNDKGIKISTYLCKTTNPVVRGSIILIHGNREYFKSNFLNYNKEWNFEQFGYPSFPNINSIDDFELNIQRTSWRNDKNKYSEFFTQFDNYNRNEFNSSMVELFNNAGLNVYGMDLQSFGYSEGMTSSRCYVNHFDDFINDLTKFIDIIRSNKFFSSSVDSFRVRVDEVDGAYRGGQIYILGYSMGANIVMQTLQHINKLNKMRGIGGVIILSGMLKLDQRFSNYITKIISLFSLSFMSLLAPKSECERTAYGDWTMKINDYHKLNVCQ